MEGVAYTSSTQGIQGDRIAVKCPLISIYSRNGRVYVQAKQGTTWAYVVIDSGAEVLQNQDQDLRDVG